jgi:hypothetical protein
MGVAPLEILVKYIQCGDEYCIERQYF